MREAWHIFHASRGFRRVLKPALHSTQTHAIFRQIASRGAHF